MHVLSAQLKKPRGLSVNWEKNGPPPEEDSSSRRNAFLELVSLEQSSKLRLYHVTGLGDHWKSSKTVQSLHVSF
jgi:hypothetical protein